MIMNKHIENERYILSDVVGKYDGNYYKWCIKRLKNNKKLIQNDQKQWINIHKWRGRFTPGRSANNKGEGGWTPT